MNEFIGPNYPYHKNISLPDEMEMSTHKDSLDNNFAGLINYGSLLMFGDKTANKKILYEQANLGGQQPLGDRIFVKTPGKCKKRYWDGENIIEEKENQEDDGERPERHVYIDHIPTGNIPDLGNLSSMKGFIPGILDNIFKLNPTKILRAMGEPIEPDCLEIEFETIQYNKENEISKQHDVLKEKKWVSIQDLKDLNPCTFKTVKTAGYPRITSNPDGSTLPVPQSGNGKNFIHPLDKETYPVGVSCDWMSTETEEPFANLFKMKNKHVRNPIINVKNKPLAKIFNASFGILLTYLLFRILRKELN